MLFGQPVYFEEVIKAVNILCRYSNKQRIFYLPPIATISHNSLWTEILPYLPFGPKAIFLPHMTYHIARNVCYLQPKPFLRKAYSNILANLTYPYTARASTQSKLFNFISNIFGNILLFPFLSIKMKNISHGYIGGCLFTWGNDFYIFISLEIRKEEFQTNKTEIARVIIHIEIISVCFIFNYIILASLMSF